MICVKKISQHCADMDFETPLYGNEAEQTQTIRGWIQAHHDVIKLISDLRIAIQKTNLVTPVIITLTEDLTVTKTIAEWIHRRRDLSKMELSVWQSLGDRGLKEGQLPATQPGGQPRDCKIRRYYDPKERDAKIELFASEASTIDATLEVTNAITDLIQE